MLLRRRLLPLVFALLSFAPVLSAAAEPLTYGPELEGFDYPYPVQQFAFASQGANLHMAYMDIGPIGTPRGAVALLHGKNFCGATCWRICVVEPTCAASTAWLFCWRVWRYAR